MICLDAESRVVLWNPAAERLLGWKREEVVGRPYPALPEQYESEHSRIITQVLSGETFAAIETRRRRKDGALVDVSISAVPLRDGSRVIGALGMLEEIGERRRLQAQYVQAQKMECIGRLAGGVAHDFNNMLTSILGYAAFVGEELPEGDQRRADIDEIRRSAGRAADITRQLLAFSRRQIISPRVVRLDSLVLGMDKMLRRIVGESVELALIPPASLSNVQVDPGQIEQVILNLAVNARDAMPSGGKLTLDFADVAISAEEAAAHPGMTPGKYVRLRLTDNGIGMDAEVKSRLFEPFFTTKPDGRGTGLGLATCYGIVKQSGGYIAVDSAPGEGAVFSIFLPRTEEPLGAADAPGDLPAKAPRGRERILIAEDEPSVLQSARRMLLALGYQVTAVLTGDEALRVAREAAARGAPFDLVFTDLVMPRMGGLELAQALGSDPGGVKILFTSGYVEQGLPADNRIPFLPKPYVKSELADHVRAALDA